MSTIANLAVQLMCDPTKFTLGLSDASKAMKKFQSSSLNPGQWAKAASQNFGAIQKNITGVIGPVKDLLSAIPIVGGAFAALPTSMSGALSVVKENIKEMSAMAKQAQKLGLSIESYGAIAALAGGDSELMDRALFKMSATLGELATGSVAATEKFRNLGMSAQEFVGLDTEQSLAKIMDKFQGMTSFAEKAHVATELMGRGAITLVPALSKGSAGLAEMGKRARDMGLSFDSVQAVGVMRASKAMKEIDLITKGIQRQFAIEFAPIVGTVAESFTAWLKTVGGLRGAFAGMAEGTGHFLGNTASGLAVLIEEVAYLVDLLHDFKRVADFARTSMAWSDKLTPTGPIKGLFGGGQLTSDAASVKFKTPAKFIQEMAVKLQNLSSYFTVATKGAQQFGASLPNQRILDLMKKTGELIDSLDAEITAYGRSSHAVALNKLAMEAAANEASIRARQAANAKLGESLANSFNDAGKVAAYHREVAALAEASATARLTQELIANASARARQLELLERITGGATQTLTIYDETAARLANLTAALLKGQLSAEAFDAGWRKLKDGLAKTELTKAAEVFQQTRTPLEGFQAKLSELDGMLDRGAITWDTYARAVGAAGKALQKTGDTKLAGAAEFGSQEAYGAVAKAQAGTAQGSGIDGLKDVMKQLLEVAKRDAKNNEDVARAARKGLLAPGKIG